MRWTTLKYNEEGEIKRHNRQPVAYKIKQMKLSLYLIQFKKIKRLLWKIY